MVSLEIEPVRQIIFLVVYVQCFRSSHGALQLHGPIGSLTFVQSHHQIVCSHRVEIFFELEPRHGSLCVLIPKLGKDILGWIARCQKQSLMSLFVLRQVPDVETLMKSC